MRIAILNVKYSPNLGDGAIAECLESQLRKRIPGVDVFSIDIGGMDDYGTGGSILGSKLGLTRKMAFLPEATQKTIKLAMMPTMVKWKYADKWREQLKNCDAIVIGGGHLFMDIDLYFPHRIMTAVKAAPKGIPIFVHAVGVSKQWTKRGVKCFNEAFAHGRLVQASVRDQQSLDNWLEHFSLIKPKINRDPAILAQECYGVMSPISGDRKLVALGVADLGNMLQHSDQNTGVVCGHIPAYLETVQALHDAGYAVMLFTNGGDDEYLQSVAAALKEQKPQLANVVKVAPRASRPAELVKQITSAHALVAHRLHANILAYAYGVPNIGLGWDRKLRSFFEATKRLDFLITSDNDASIQIVQKLQQLLSGSVVDGERASIMSAANDGADQLAAAIQQNVRSR